MIKLKIMNKRLLIPSIVLLAISACNQETVATYTIPTPIAELAESENYHLIPTNSTTSISIDGRRISTLNPGDENFLPTVQTHLIREENLALLAGYSDEELQNLKTYRISYPATILVIDELQNQTLLTDTNNIIAVVELPDGKLVVVTEEGRDETISKSDSIAGLYIALGGK